MVETFRKVNKQMDDDGFSARNNFFNQVCGEQMEWQYAAQSASGNHIVLVNEKKFLICYDLAKDRVANHIILDIIG